MKPIAPVGRGLSKIAKVLNKNKVSNLAQKPVTNNFTLDLIRLKPATTRTAKACFLSDLFEKLFERN